MNIDIDPGAPTKSAARRYVLAGVTAVVAAGFFAAGFYARDRIARNRPSFHDMRVNHVSDLTALVAPGDPAVRALAERLGTPEAAYIHVRDRIRYMPMAPATRPGRIIVDGEASCLGKAALLCSLYRSMGIPAKDIRIVTGDVVRPDGLADHAWIDLEYKGRCLQQDPSGFLGVFDFAQFGKREFTWTFVFEEDYCFNENGLAVVSRLNRFGDDFPGGMGSGRQPPARASFRLDR
ncbi:MAG: transglutaminase-like domain-containing protein [Deltaproteobacteria bacterium]